MLSNHNLFGVRGIHGNVPFELRSIALYEAQNWAKRLGAPQVFIPCPSAYNDVFKNYQKRVDRLTQKGYLEKAEAIRKDLRTCDQIFFEELLCT